MRLKVHLILAVFALLGGCANVRMLTAPAVSVAEISVGELTPDGRNYVVELLVRNRTKQELPLSHVIFELALEISDAVRIERPLSLVIPPLGSERIRLELTGGSEGPAEELTKLSERGGSLSYHVSGELTSPLSDDPLRFERHSQLSPTPGAPGKFRS